MPIASAQTIEYTPSTKTVCNGNVCTKTLYSGTRFVYEGNIWKPIEQADSLKGIWNLLWLEVDPDFNISVLNYNYSGMDLQLQFTGDPLDYPIDCPTYKSPDEFKCQFKVQYKENGNDIKFDYKYEMKGGVVTQNTNKFSYNGIPLGKEFKFGGNSTTITINDTNGEILEDTSVFQYYKTTAGGSSTVLHTAAGANGYSSNTFIKWDVSNVINPNTISIIEANMYLKKSTNLLDSGEAINITAYHVFKYPRFNITDVNDWDEGVSTCFAETLCWDDQPTLPDIEYNSTADDEITIDYTDTTSIFHGWNITESFRTALSDSEDVITTWLNTTVESGSPDISSFGDYVGWNSKEASNPANSPYIIVEYISQLPQIKSVVKTPTAPAYNDSVNITANVTTDSGTILWVNYTITAPNGTVIIDNANGTQYSVDLWNVTEFYADRVGDWQIEINASTTSGVTAYHTQNFTIILYPRWYDNQSSTPTYYNPSPTFHFNITWNITYENASNVTTIYIETNLTGTATNYTATNATFGDDIFNWTISGTPYKAAQYYWKSWGNNTEGYWNVTDTWYFTIAQNTSNPLYLNATYSGVSHISTAFSTTSDVSVKLQSYMNYSNSGTPELWINNVSYANPTTATWGVGTYNITVNSTGNTNYTINSTGVTFIMTITAPATPPAGGGGGGAPPTSNVCNVTLLPKFGFGGSASSGKDIAPFTLQIFNKNLTQSFSVSISGDASGYCAVDQRPELEIQPFGRDVWTIRCVAPNGTITGNVDIESSLGCAYALPITISESIDIIAEISNAILFLASGDFMGFMASPVLGMPVWLWLIIITFMAIILLYRWK